MTIRSNPPGAVVSVDDYEIGAAPVSTDFTYYGTRKIRLVKDGCETLTVMQPVPTPWYQIPPLDFVFENLVPGEIRDQRTFTYELMPQMVVPQDQLLQRAEELRNQARLSGEALPSQAGEAPLLPLPAAGSYAPPPPAMGHPLPPGYPASGGMPVHPLPPGP